RRILEEHGADRLAVIALDDHTVTKSKPDAAGVEEELLARAAQGDLDDLRHAEPLSRGGPRVSYAGRDRLDRVLAAVPVALSRPGYGTGRPVDPGRLVCASRIAQWRSRRTRGIRAGTSSPSARSGGAASRSRRGGRRRPAPVPRTWRRRRSRC